jgi:hypothetical protein
MEDQIKQAVDILKEAHDKIAEVMTDPNLAIRRTGLLLTLKKNADMMTMHTSGESPLREDRPTGQPLRKFFGKVVSSKSADETTKPVAPKATEPLKFNSAEEVAKDEFKKKVKGLYEVFAGTDNDVLLDTYSDVELRGVAKLAKLPVTEKNPKKIDASYIDIIKDAINKLSADGKGNAGQEPGAGSNTGDGK